MSSQASGFPTLSLDDQIPALVTPLEQTSGPFQKHRSAPSLPIHWLPPGPQHQSLRPRLPAWPTPILLNSAEAPCEPPSIPGRAPASGEGRPVLGPGGAGAVLPRSTAASAGASSHRGPESVCPHCCSISQQGWFQGGREIVLSSLTHLPTMIPSLLLLTQSDNMFWVKITHSPFQAKDLGVGELPGQRLPGLLCPGVLHTVPVPEMHISCPLLLLTLVVPGRGWELPAAGDAAGQPQAPTPPIPTRAHCAACH